MQWIINRLTNTRNKLLERIAEIDSEIKGYLCEIDRNNQTVIGFQSQIDEMRAVIDRFPDTQIAKSLAGSIEMRHSAAVPMNEPLKEKITALEMERTRIAPELAEFTRVVDGLLSEFPVPKVTLTYHGDEAVIEVS